MCIVCLEWEKGKLTNLEAPGALMELINTGEEDWEHFLELSDRIEENEQNQKG